MGNKIRLDEAVELGIIRTGYYLDITQLQTQNVLETKAEFSKQLTGFHTLQTFYGEKLSYRFVKDLDYDGSMSVIGSVTKQQIALYGQKGYDNIEEVFTRAVRTMALNVDGSIIRAMNLEDAKKLQEIDALKVNSIEYLLCSKNCSSEYGGKKLKVIKIDNYGRVSSVYLLFTDSEAEEHYYRVKRPIRPVISLPKNIWCEVTEKNNGEGPEKAVKLFTPLK